MKRTKWEDIFNRLETGEISEERAQEEIVKNYCVPNHDRIYQCN